MFMQRAYPTGTLKTDAYAAAIAWKKQQPRRSSSALPWEFAGPLNIGGRITDIEIPIDQPQTYYIGAASGGVFKTIDGGVTWNPIFDEQEMLSIGDIEISKNDTDIIWVGTGEVNAGGGSLAYDGNGMFRSADGGLTWESKGLPDVGSIGKILIDPNDENTVLVGAMGPLFRNDVNRGVYKTTDGGATWEQKLFVSDSTGIIDMAMHPTNGDIVYAASWERIRRPNRRQYGGETSGLYKSTDGGETWSELTNGLPTAAADKGRINIDISQSNPNVLYARYVDTAGSIEGFYRTDDGGATWVEKNTGQLTNVGFHWWFGGVFVDPTDEDIVYNVDFEVQKSTNGGANWSDSFSNVHVDQHAMAFNASVAGEVLLGNDGGLYKSTNDGASSVKNLNLPITQFYRMYVDALNPSKIYGGAQDNSTSRTTSGGLSDWNIIYGGDGFQPLVDFTNTNVIYALSQNGNLGKSTNNGASFFGATNGISSGDRKNWDTPVTQDPLNSQVLYYGTQRLYKTTNAASNWTAISGDLSNGTNSGNLTFGTITTIDVSPIDTNLIFVGTDDGNVWRTDDGGVTWEQLSANLPERWVTKVKADPYESERVYVTFSGYRYGEDGGHVFYSEDRGETWIDITRNLPNIPVSDIEIGGWEGVFLATDIGVMRVQSPGEDWEPFGENLPSVVVTDLFMNSSESSYLYAATYGRSMYKIYVGEANVDGFDFAESVSVAPNPASDLVTISMKNPSEIVSVIVYDALGRAYFEHKFSGGENSIQFSVEEFSIGMYWVKITSGTSQVTKKLIVK
ncbi:hypothetical protein GCM10008083_10420 [Ulvibacter litoralis]|nr:hypothetical protein GCM10008083_10420 [Ulvibacter litoralis]